MNRYNTSIFILFMLIVMGVESRAQCPEPYNFNHITHPCSESIEGPKTDIFFSYEVPLGCSVTFERADAPDINVQPIMAYNPYSATGFHSPIEEVIYETWIRAVCDCNGLIEFSDWVYTNAGYISTNAEAVSVISTQSDCASADPISWNQTFGFNSAYVGVHSGVDPCTGNEELIQWKRFSPDESGNATFVFHEELINSQFNSTDPTFSLVVTDVFGCTNLTSLHCQSDLNEGDTISISGMNPNWSHRVGIMANGFEEYLDDSYIDDSDPCRADLYVVSLEEVIFCSEDISGDGVIDINDFIAFNSAFGSSCSGCPEDINEDGIVDIDDFIQLNSMFGSTCP